MPRTPPPTGRPSGRPRTAVVPLTVLVAAVLVLCGCATSLPPAGEGSVSYSARVVRVVAAEDFWGSIAGQIGGAHAHVVSIIDNPETDPHAYEPTAADARTLADAQVAIANGAGYDPWMQHLLAADGGRRQVLDVGDLVGVAPGGNPHLWYDPTYVNRVIAAVTSDLQRSDPADASYFAERRRAFERVGLADYHGEIARIRSQFAGTRVGASESVVVYLCHALGLDLVTPPTFLRAISEGTDVSPSDKATIDRQIQSRSIAVYLENTQNLTPDVQSQVDAATAARIPLVTVTETLQPAGVTFQAWQTRQLVALDTALEHAHG